MLVYVAGSGAMGCRFGYQIQRSGKRVILLDNWEPHVKAIKENGVQIVGDEEFTVQIPMMEPQEATEKGDLVILFTKAMQLDQMLQDIQHLIGDETKVLCLLNGLGHEDVIKKYIPEKNIIMGVTIWTAGIVGPGVVKLQGVGAIDLNILDSNEKDKALEIVELLNAADLHATYVDDAKPAIWRKAVINGTMNSLCALLDCTIGELFNTEMGVNLVHQIIDEFVRVAEAEGVKLDKDAVTKYVFDTYVIAANHYPSMHQDLVQQKRYTEIDYLNGKVSKLAEKHGFSTPVCKTVTELIHTKEQLTVK